MASQRRLAAVAVAVVLADLPVPGAAHLDVAGHKKWLRQSRPLLIQAAYREPERSNATTTTKEAAPTYNEETEIVKVDSPIEEKKMSISVEVLFAILYVSLISCVPVLLSWADHEEKMGIVAVSEIFALVVWLVGGVILFTNVIGFQSAHWTGIRPLTIVETVYLLSQIITTVGYGDITPAYQRGQIVIGFYVLVSLLIIANVVTAVSTIVLKHVHHHVNMLTMKTVKGRGGAEAASEASDGAGAPETEVDEPEVTPQTMKATDGPDAPAPLAPGLQNRAPPKEHFNFLERPKIDLLRLTASGIGFFCFVLMGVLFYHYYPGEEKTWLEAVYMSIITLSTVGFGAFNATTEGGKVFGAFWMLFGVAALVSFVAAFAEITLKMKEIERWDGSTEEMRRNLEAMNKSPGDRLTRHEFVSFALLQGKLATREQLAQIEAEWQRLRPNAEGVISTSFLKP